MVLPQLSDIKRAALDFVFPRYCVGCGREGEFLCPSCRSAINRLFPPWCPLCGRPQASGVLCADCVNWKADIDGIRSPFCFGGAIREAIHQLKYRNLRAVSGLLAGYLYEYLQDYPVSADCIVPVPLHPRRLRERGYNQSALLAAELGKLTGMPVYDNSLTREYFASPQAKTGNVAQRRQNVYGMFACKDRRLAGSKILLIDDVATSGSTLDACAGALKAAGVISVTGLVVAREI
jgi:ComF family protein